MNESGQDHGLSVRLVTPTGELFSGAVSVISLPSLDGEVEILPGHADYVTMLGSGLLIVDGQEGGGTRFAIRGGFLSCTNGEVRVLADEARSPSGLDRDDLTREIAAIESELGTVSGYESQWSFLSEKHTFLTTLRSIAEG